MGICDAFDARVLSEAAYLRKLDVLKRALCTICLLAACVSNPMASLRGTMMSEYTFVEKRFLDQLRALGWQVIDQTEGGASVPTDPARSLRADFRQLVLPQVFRASVAAINTLPDGSPG